MVRVCSFALFFLPLPRSYSCSGKKCALPPSGPLVDHRPKRSDMVRRGCNVCGGEGVSLQYIIALSPGNWAQEK